jgi:hypothetical protein
MHYTGAHSAPYTILTMHFTLCTPYTIQVRIQHCFRKFAAMNMVAIMKRIITVTRAATTIQVSAVGVERMRVDR